MSRDGMLAMMDAAIFMMVLMAAIAVTLQASVPDGTHDGDAGDLLDGLLSSKVRMSDLSEEGDGSLVRMSDMIALYLVTGDDGVGDYLSDLLDSMSRGRGYFLEMSFGEHGKTMGSPDGTMSASAERTVPVTTGGELVAVLTLYRSRSELLGAVRQVHGYRDDVVLGGGIIDSVD